jgi:hypothetical protein
MSTRDNKRRTVKTKSVDSHLNYQRCGELNVILTTQQVCKRTAHLRGIRPGRSSSSKIINGNRPSSPLESGLRIVHEFSRVLEAS